MQTVFSSLVFVFCCEATKFALNTYKNNMNGKKAFFKSNVHTCIKKANTVIWSQLVINSKAMTTKVHMYSYLIKMEWAH